MYSQAKTHVLTVSFLIYFPCDYMIEGLGTIVRLNLIIFMSMTSKCPIYLPFSLNIKRSINNARTLHGILNLNWLLKHLLRFHFRHRHQKDHNCEKLVEKITPTKTAEHVQQILGISIFNLYHILCSLCSNSNFTAHKNTLKIY